MSKNGVSLTVLRDYLGHVSVATTNRYVTSNLKMKRDSLKRREKVLAAARHCEMSSTIHARLSTTPN